MDSSDPPERTGPALQSRPDSARLPHWITVLLLLGACVAARLWCLVCKPFWFDEAYSVELARIDWRNFAHLLWWREANMSLYYLLLRGWMHLGQSPFFIRTLSVIFSAATLPAVYWLARLLFNRRVAIIAASLFAFNAYSVRYSQEARSYALFLLLTTLSSAFVDCMDTAADTIQPHGIHRGQRVGRVRAFLCIAAHRGTVAGFAIEAERAANKTEKAHSRCDARGSRSESQFCRCSFS